MDTPIKGYKTRKAAADKAREVSANPYVSQIPDGSWIAVGDLFSETGHSLYGADGSHCWASDLGDHVAQVDYLGYTERA